jgi:uncharacterized repeat protein (TIGR01451 family)
MKCLASLLLICMCHQLSADQVSGPESLMTAFQNPQVPPLRPQRQQVVYFSATPKVQEGKSGIGVIQLRYPELVPVEFLIQNSPDGQIIAPFKVGFPAGKTRGQFEFNTRDDLLVNLMRTSDLRLFVGKFEIASIPVRILDNEQAPTLSLRIPKRLIEGEDKSTGSVTLDRPADVDIALELDHTPKGRISCPRSVIIPAGDTRRDFGIGANEDSKINGDSLVTVAARSPGITTSIRTIRVKDNESTELDLKLPEQVVEASPAIGSVEISGKMDHAVDITLLNDASSRLTMPKSVRIPAGKTKVEFTLNAVDTTDGDSTVNVSIRANAKKFSSSEASTVVREIAGLPRIRSIPLATNDLVWDAVSGLIYASVPSSAGAPYGNHIIALDPDSLQITASLEVYQEPGQLALTSGGEFLYVVCNGNGTISKIALADFTVSQVFAVGTDPDYGTLFAEDICTVAGQPNLLVVSQYRKSVSPRHDGVAVYDNGVARAVKSQDHTGSNVIEPSADPTIFFGYNNETTEYGFRRIKLDASGMTELDVNTGLIDGFYTDIHSDGDMVISTSGVVVDGAHLKRAGTYPISSYPGAICLDHTSNRVYFMMSDSDDWVHFNKIVAFDPSTRTPICEMTLANAADSPASLIRWGSSGLAYRTAKDVVLITNEQLVPGGPPADLAVTVQASPIPATAGLPLTYTVQVTNSGPNVAHNVVVSASLSPRQKVKSTNSPHGSPIVSGRKVSLTVATIASGATKSLTVAATPLSAGSVNCTASAASNAVDPDYTNNTGFELVSVGFQSTIDSVNSLYLKANNLVYDSTRQLLWASIPDTVDAPLGRSVVSIDPLTGLLSDPLPLNANPHAGSMALSANGRYLYVGLTDVPDVHRIDLESEEKAAARISLPLSQWQDANYARDIEVLDGDGTSFIYTGTDDHSAAVMDGTVKRATRTSIYSVDRLARSGTPGIFIGFDGDDLSRLSVTPAGVSVSLKQAYVIGGYATEITGDGDFVLSSTGRLIDGRTLTLIADLSTYGAPCLDAANQRAYMVSGNVLYVFNVTNGNPIRSYNLRSSESGDWAERCIRWGVDGLAVLGNDGIIHIARLSLVNPAAMAPAMAAASVSQADGAPDSDGDGLSDRIEQFFGTSTTEVTANPLKISMQPGDDHTILHLVFPRRSGLAMPAYGYQVSGDLREWHTPQHVSESVISVNVTNGVEVETIDASIRIPKVKAAFVRLVWPQ